MGSNTLSVNSSLISCNAPISPHETSGTVAKPSRFPLGCTVFTAFKKSPMVIFKGSNSSSLNRSLRSASIFPKILFTALTAASFVKLFKSAPTYPGVFFATNSKSNAPSILNPLVMHFNISTRASSSGTPKQISRSNRPARRNAGSIPSARFVAPITITLPPPPPSASESSAPMHVNNCATILFSIPLSLPAPRFAATASISSINTKLGAAARAVRNNSLTRASLSPLTPPMISGAERGKKGRSSSPATACARWVFPVPGGPRRSIPRGGVTPRWVKSSGWRRG
mmetsp:Transcript_61372/g.72907  ORF Transcript_61372/g.72907 Transcript_61372/m.72907 type:complete len:284 (+) Transcript_61372:970-1821(+)